MCNKDTCCHESYEQLYTFDALPYDNGGLPARITHFHSSRNVVCVECSRSSRVAIWYIVMEPRSEGGITRSLIYRTSTVSGSLLLAPRVFVPRDDL
jgi:hypothetical protein